MEVSLKVKKRNIDMTEGSPIKSIILFTLPLLFGNIFQQLYNIVDSMVVGNFIGDEALAAVSSSGSLINLLIGLIQGMTIGAGIVIAQYFGAKDTDRMRKAIHTTVAFSIVLGIGMTIIGVVLSPIMLVWMQTDSEVLPLSIIYFQTYFCGVIFTLMYNAGSAIFRAIGDSRHPLIYLIIACGVNIFLDLLFVGLFHWGVIGVAIATIISQAISFALTFIKLMKDKTNYQVVLKEVKFTWAELKKIVAYGLPAGIQNSIISFSNVFIQSNINAFGKIAQAGCGSYQKIEGFATMPSGSFSMALSTYVGQNIGAQKYDRVKKGALQGLALDLIVTEVLGLILYIFAPWMIGWFSNTPEIISVGVSQTRTIVLFYFLLAFAHGMSGILRGAGYSKIPMVTMIVCWVLVRVCLIPVALNIPGWNHIETIFWFYPFTWSLSFVVLTIVALSVKWCEKKN